MFPVPSSTRDSVEGVNSFDSTGESAVFVGLVGGEYLWVGAFERGLDIDAVERELAVDRS